MSTKKVKDTAKIFISDQALIQQKTLATMDKISRIVGSTLGPSGRPCLIESEHFGIANKNTKDGVTVFKALGANDPFEQLIIEQTRDAASRTATEAGDGPQPLWSKILTPSGFVRMGDIEVGMDICGINNTVQKVLGVFPKGQKEIYRITFSDERVVECSEDHLWTVTTAYGVEKTLTVKEMLKDFKTTKSDGAIYYKYYTPKTVANFKQKTQNLPLDPYLVGLLLGDGSLAESGSIELSLGKRKQHVLDKIMLPNGLSLQTKYVDNKNSYRVKIQGETAEGKTIRDFVKETGLNNTNSHSKHIPDQYLFSSAESRKALLQGLIDTDGHINNRGCFEFTSVSPNLAEDFTFLARSLGFSVITLNHDRKANDGTYSKNSIYRVTQIKGYKHGDKIFNIEPTGQFTEMQCIKVSNPDHLYITDGFIATHNTTTATILSAALTRNLLTFCNKNKKISPQRAVRVIQSFLKNTAVPYIQSEAIKIDVDNQDLLFNVAKISANGDDEMARAVIQAFELTGMTTNSHVTIQELSGPGGYDVDLVEGFPITMGYEESAGKFGNALKNDEGNQRCVLEKPLFILFDGQINDLINFEKTLEKISDQYTSGDADFKNVVLVSHGFSEAVLTTLTYNFANPGTINIVPLVTPMTQIVNSRFDFLNDLAAFTGAKVFGLTAPIKDAQPEDFGTGMERFEMYRFKSTVVGKPDELNIELRANTLKSQMENPESMIAKIILQERLGKLTSGIAKLKIFAGSAGELKEKHDRAEDAVCAVRGSITHGILPGGCRILLNLAIIADGLETSNVQESLIAKEVIMPSLLEPIGKLLDNAGYSEEEADEVVKKLTADTDLVYDVENQKYGSPFELGVFDALKAVEEALKNAVSIASVMGVMGGMVVFPRDHQLEREEAQADRAYMDAVNDPTQYVNEANNRG